MTSKYILGAAGIALIAATGSAQAADVPTMPTTIATIAPAAPTGPAIEIKALLNGGQLFFPFFDYYIEIDIEGVVDFQRPGWSFQFLGEFEWDFPGDEFYLGVRSYRSFGDLTAGAYAAFNDGFDLHHFELGADFEFMAGALSVYNDTYFHFDAFHVHTDTTVKFAVNDRLTVYGEMDLRLLDGPADVHLEAGAELNLGNITPYAYVHWENFSFWGVDAGVRLERPIGNGGLSLLGEVDVGLHTGDFLDVEVSIGVRYARGGPNAPWWW